eukprot:jgi/Psemu1/44409/gm1.44409_g
MCRPDSTPTTSTVSTKKGVTANANANGNGNASAATTIAVRPAKDLLAEHDQWLADFDFVAFSKEVRELGKKLEKNQGPQDVAHLNKMIGWSNTFAAIGLLTMGFGVNIITIVCLSLYTFSRWTMIAHHVCHGGYEKCHPENKGRWSRFKFGLGTFWRRFNDWFDWMMPEAWNVEHNNRHHYRLSELHDPDLVEANMDLLREANVPKFVKYIAVGVLAVTWKWFYYAPNTYKELKLAQMRRKGVKIPDHIHPHEPMSFRAAICGESTFFYSFSELMAVVLLPYLVLHFFVAPLPYLLVEEHLGYGSTEMYWNAVKNLFWAELLTNAHAFLAIATNHAGDDMYRFRKECRPFSGSFFLRQVLASVDYNTGTDSVDFFHGWLNYQIEHHVWPNLSMLSYQRSAPELEAVCKKHNVPYIKHNVFWRLKKTIDIMVGNTSMRWLPEDYEEQFLAADARSEKAAAKKAE